MLTVTENCIVMVMVTWGVNSMRVTTFAVTIRSVSCAAQSSDHELTFVNKSMKTTAEIRTQKKIRNELKFMVQCCLCFCWMFSMLRTFHVQS